MLTVSYGLIRLDMDKNGTANLYKLIFGNGLKSTFR